MRSAAIGTAMAVLAVGPSISASAQPDRGALVAAVLNGDHAMLRRLIAQGGDVNGPRPDGSTALAWAVDHQDLESVTLLLAAKANPNTHDQDGISPLLVACERGDAAIVIRLVDARARVAEVRPDGITALALCAGSSTPAALSRLVAAGADVNAASPKGQTPLMRAASTGNVANLRFLVQNGADINRASEGGFTPLFFAIKSRVPAAPLAVMELGGDPAYVAPDGTTALELSLLAGDFNLASELVRRGVDVNRWDINGRQPLHVAAVNNAVEFAKLLLGKGANPNVLTKQAYRVISNGSEADKLSVWPETDPTVRVVLRHRSDGAAIAPPPPARTALMLAAEAGSLDMMKLLASAGTKTDFKAADGTNLVLSSISSGNAEVVRLALQLDPEVNAVTDNGNTAMHLAVQATQGIQAMQTRDQRMEIVRVLAAAGARLDVRNNRGQTPESIAERGSDDIKALYAQLLREQRATRASSP